MTRAWRASDRRPGDRPDRVGGLISGHGQDRTVIAPWPPGAPASLGDPYRRTGQSPGSPSSPACRNRPADGAAARIPHPCRVRGGGAWARRRHPRGQGDRRPLRGVLQPGDRDHLPHLSGRARERDDLRGRAAERRHPNRALRRVPGPLSRARRCAVADRRGRPRGPSSISELLAGSTTVASSARW